MSKLEFIRHYQAARAALLAVLDGLEEAEASAVTGGEGEWPTIKALIGHLAAWEREALTADEMIKRGEENHLNSLHVEEFNRRQAVDRQDWPLEQVRSELDLNYEALLMAWDEYEGEDGPAGPASWEPGRPGSWWWLVEHQIEHGREIARRRGLEFN